MISVHTSRHISVLLNEIVDSLNLKKGSVIVDGTFGGGGHSAEICRKSKGVKIVAIDQDANAWRSAKDKFEGLDCDVTFVNGNFRDLTEILDKKGVPKVDGVILDLGLSSDQLENSGRGFSFMKSEPLLMTMKENPRPEDLTAIDVVNTWSEQSLADIIYGYGEEKYSRKIARAIVETRKKTKIETTFDLVKIIRESVPSSYAKGRINPATKTFQALRIAVNDELGALEAGLKAGFDALADGGRMLVISFHSLEDRMVKRFCKGKSDEREAKLITKKPIVALDTELKENPRSRSAKLRILEKI
ncbi:MAG: 16S rRNA (cytosine(1402)-N(4))-methyltransferase RsmH [bacterium]|nr:16S rRNA (cytosine(1402)-N(4))-methyltransferase RsmH [bacterium]